MMVLLCFHSCLESPLCHPRVRMVVLNVLLSLTYSVTYSHQETLLLYTQRCGAAGAVHSQAIDSVLLLPVKQSCEPLPHCDSDSWQMLTSNEHLPRVLLGQVFVLPTVTMGQCYFACPHRRWESEAGRLGLPGEITISKLIYIFITRLRVEKQENELTLFFPSLKVLGINCQ